MSSYPSGGVNPFLAAQQFIGNRYAQGASDLRYEIRNRAYEDALALHKVHVEGVVQREAPTPANTGAPLPGYKVRGPINPSTTGAPVPGTLKDNMATHPISNQKVPTVPVKRKGSKQTAPGTNPKQR